MTTPCAGTAALRPPSAGAMSLWSHRSRTEAGFAESPQVINGASDLFVKLYGEAGKHARAAVTVAGLPRNATAEIQVTVRFE